MKGSKGYYTGTRSLLRKPTREKGKPHIGKILQEYQIGSQVIIRLDSSVQKSMPHKRFHGKIRHNNRKAWARIRDQRASR